ncbi:MAG: DMT family transporter [Actinobacteria bacterium]|nr:DMT family transporter [Actinomycetota bacterium]
MVTGGRRPLVQPLRATKQNAVRPRFTLSVEAAAELQAPARDWAALAAAGITVVLWASAFVGIRSAGRTFSPGALSLGRLAVAVAALAVIGAVRGERLPTREALRAVAWPLLVCGLLWFAAYNVALNAGERHVDAGTAAMLVNVGPILIAVLAGIVLGEGFPRTLFAGLAVAFAGVVVIAVASSTHTATTGGVLLCLAAACAYAAGVVAQKVILRRLTPVQTVFCCAVIGVLATLPFAPQLARQLGPAHAEGWVAYLGIGPTALGFITWGFALSRTNAGKLAVTTYLVPPISILLGWLWLSESPASLAYLGGALCLGGVALSRRPSGAGRRAGAAAGTGSRS